MHNGSREHISILYYQHHNILAFTTETVTLSRSKIVLSQDLDFSGEEKGRVFGRY